MPSAAEVEYEGFVQLADLAVGGPDDAGLPDGAELPDGAGPMDPAGWLADADADADAPREPAARADAGMVAMCGLETTCGIAGAADAVEGAPAPAVACSANPSTAAGLPPGPGPLARRMAAVRPPPATRAPATTRPITPRREGAKTGRQRDSGACVPASFPWSLVALWRTRRSLRAAAPGSRRS